MFVLQTENDDDVSDSILEDSHCDLFGDIDEPLNSGRKTTYDENMTEYSISKVNVTTTDFSICNDKFTTQKSYNNSLLLKNKRDEMKKNSTQRNKKSYSVMSDLFS